MATAPRSALAVFACSATLASFLGMIACDDTSTHDSTIAGTEAPVVYDVDDRLDYYELPNDAFAAQGRGSVVALVRGNRLEQNGATYDIVGEPTLDESVDLCPTERFATQPLAAFCSGTLIDDDLVLTAGHCILPVGALGAGAPHCSTTRFVFDFLEVADGVLETIDVEDVYSCRAVVAHHLDDDLDYAVVQLDRPVVGRTPAPLRAPARLSVGTPVAEIGFPTGMPMKFDRGGQVTDPGPSNGTYFVTDLDAFHGNSGSGVLDASGAVVGILVRTLVEDYVFDPTSRCYRVSRLPTLYASEMVTYLDGVVNALCVDQAYPSMRVCARSAACGDGFCTNGETVSCPGDCSSPVCGDGVVESDETPTSCPYDFGLTIASANSGCSVSRVPRHGGFTSVLLVVFAIVAIRARRRRLPFALLLAWLVCLAPSTTRADAVIEPRGARFVGALEGTVGPSYIRDPSGQFPSVRTSGLGGGIRLGVDIALGRYFALELAGTVRGFLDLGSTYYELTAAPRIRYGWWRKQEIYLRLPMGGGVGVITSGDVRPAGIFGLSVGYRRQLTRVVDVFGEIGVSMRFVRDVDPTFGFTHGYGFHPSAPPSIVTDVFGITLGIGIGRGTKPVCPGEVSPDRRPSRTER